MIEVKCPDCGKIWSCEDFKSLDIKPMEEIKCQECFEIEEERRYVSSGYTETSWNY